MKQNKKSKAGFALIATILLMVLLAIITIGTLSLSVVTLRSGNQDSAQARARANARMALMIAIGELQKQMGPDQRISANSAILDESTVTHSHWLGVWDSWKAGTGEDSQHSTIEGISDEMSPTYLPNRSDYFRKWLVSLNDDELSDIASPTTLSLSASPLPGPNDDTIFLVADGSLGDGDEKIPDYVAARILDVKDKNTSEVTGRYGWWIGDESQKARIMADSYLFPPALTSADKIYRSQAPGSMGNTSITGLENVTDPSQFAKIPSLATLDLVPNVVDRPAQQNFFDATPFSFSILSDVREGGLKRDLSTILEQPISLTNNGQEYMLYEFDDARFPYLNNPNDARRANSRVPIQDLAAYYQLYDDQPTFTNGRRGGVQYSSSALPDSLQINVPDFDGGNKDRQRLIREYTSLYRRPVVTKVQFLVGATAQPVTPAERDWVKGVTDGTITWRNNNDDTKRGWGDYMEYMRDTDTLKLKLGIQPMVTLWNPYNLPLVMDKNQILSYGTPPLGIKIRKYRNGGADYDSIWMNLGYANNNGGGTSNGQGGGKLLNLRLGNNTIVFEPGEVKVFSIPSSTAAYLTDGSADERNTLALGSTMNVLNEWDPFGVFLLKNSAPVGHYGVEPPEVYAFDNNGQIAQTLVLSPDDRITIKIESESATSVTDRADGRNASRDAEIKGAAFSAYMIDEGYQIRWQDNLDSLRHDIMISRHGSQTNPNRVALGGFYQELMNPGFPGGTGPIEFDDKINAISGTQLKAAGENGEIIALMDFSLSIGCDTSSAASGGYGGGRRVTSRPFLHSSNAAMPFIAQSEKDSLYDYGWDWQVSKINTIEDSIMQAKPGTGNGYYGGGYTVELGTTHIIQNEVPVLPPISIASLSHAHLGGFSMAKAIPVGENPDTDKFWTKSSQVYDPTGVAFQRVTASGQNGLAPNIVQAIGNSYAHPNIPANKAFTTKQRTFDLDEGSFNIPYVDHSYLANKALWDEFFFSSIAPQPSKVSLYDSPNRSRSAKEVGNEFFQFDSTLQPTPLPNRRITAYKTNLDQDKLDALFAETDLFANGFADKIAAHLMVKGAFNINSTSVEAWKVFLSSLKGKPVAYLNGGITPQEVTPEGTTVSPNSLTNDVPVRSEDISSPNTPANQWGSGRELTDDEINELATAIVKQVKLRGPFLSLSEFVNRRLESGNPESLSSMGALQAALNDTNVSINANFRQPNRIMDAEAAGIPFEFPEAAQGPIAYGSTAYVDQADILRNFAGQLTPRGDTFVIRAYGDSLSATGQVEARAWCEAVIQRVPEYVDDSDEPYVKAADLNIANQGFGRKFLIKSFRWLNSNEV